MTRDELLTYVKREKPQLLYLSGKTCVGKTTLRGILEAEYGYTGVSFDEIIRGEIAPISGLPVGNTFLEIYSNDERRDLIGQFMTAAQRHIDTALTRGKPVVVDGTISNIATLAATLKPYPTRTIAYLHPESLDTYVRNITSRFMLATTTYDAGLPNRFWEKLDDKDFASFCETRQLNAGITAVIRSYATSSRASSVERLAATQNAFGDILVVNI